MIVEIQQVIVSVAKNKTQKILLFQSGNDSFKLFGDPYTFRNMVILLSN